GPSLAQQPRPAFPLNCRGYWPPRNFPAVTARPGPLLLCGLIAESLDSRDILQKCRRKTATRLQVLCRVVGDPDFAAGVFRDEDLQRKIESNAGRGLYERSAGVGAAEYEQFGVGHLQAGFARFPAVVYYDKKSQALRLQDSLQLFDCCIH